MMEKNVSKDTFDCVAKAKEIAEHVHAGQVDKAGKPYIGHPAAVAGFVDGEEEKAVAWLHDVVEDTETTLDDLRGYGFSDEIVEAVDCVTRRKGEDRSDYLARVKSNPLATVVKLADLRHNSDLSRLENPGQKDFERRNKYFKEIEYLKAAPEYFMMEDVGELCKRQDGKWYCYGRYGWQEADRDYHIEERLAGKDPIGEAGDPYGYGTASIFDVLRSISKEEATAEMERIDKKIANSPKLNYVPTNIPVYLAMSKAQAHRDGVPQCIGLHFPCSREIYLHGFDELAPELFIGRSGEFAWEKGIHTTKDKIPAILKAWKLDPAKEWPNGLKGWDYQSYLDKIEGEDVWLIGFGD